MLVSLVGFEPTTRCLEGSRSILLSYRDVPKVYHSRSDATRPAILSRCPYLHLRKRPLSQWYRSQGP